MECSVQRPRRQLTLQQDCIDVGLSQGCTKIELNNASPAHPIRTKSGTAETTCNPQAIFIETIKSSATTKVQLQ